MEWLLLSHGKSSFIRSVPQKGSLLDVGCGNNSPFWVKVRRPDILYTGLDIGDYKQRFATSRWADRYIITTSEKFADEIAHFQNCFDAVISSHNLEHCDEPDRTLKAMLHAVKKGGRFYLSFPCEESVSFPKRKGTLNFYDDKSHLNRLDFKDTIHSIKAEGFTIDYAVKRSRPLFLFLIGFLFEPIAWVFSCNLPAGATWALYGFESVIWASK